MRVHFIIAGGGPAGSACAIALAKGGARCLLLERSPSPESKVGEIIDSRVREPLAELGLLNRFLALPFLRCAGTISRWGAETPAEMNSILDPYGGGFLIDRKQFEALMHQAAAEAGVDIVRGAPVRRAHATPSGWRVEIDCPEGVRSMEASFLIEATGRGRSLVAPGERTRIDRLTAVLAYPDALSHNPDSRLYIESAQDGWWYSAPLPDARSVVAFLTDADLLPTGPGAREAFFQMRFHESTLLRNRFEGRCPPITRVAPAMSTIRKCPGGADWVAIGDAAASYDPLMGLGVTMALNKGLGLARLLLSQPAHAAVTRYIDAEKRTTDDYLHTRRAIYRSETRWSRNPFWHRRAGSE